MAIAMSPSRNTFLKFRPAMEILELAHSAGILIAATHPVSGLSSTDKSMLRHRSPILLPPSSVDPVSK